MSTRQFWDPLLMWLQCSCMLEKFQQKNICYDKWIKILFWRAAFPWKKKKSQQHCQDFLLHISRTLDIFNSCFKIGCQRLQFCRHSLNSVESLCWHLEKRLECSENSLTCIRFLLMKNPTSLGSLFPPLHLQIISEGSINQMEAAICLILWVSMLAVVWT